MQWARAHVIGGGKLSTLLCQSFLLFQGSLHVQFADWVAVRAQLLLLAVLLCLPEFFQRSHLLQVQGLDCLLGVRMKFVVDEGKLTALCGLHEWP